MDAQALLGPQLGCFCIRFRPRGQQTTDSEAARALLKNCEVLVARCDAANARTLRCHSCSIFPGSPIKRIHRDDASGQSMQPPDAKGDLRRTVNARFFLEPRISSL